MAPELRKRKAPAGEPAAAPPAKKKGPVAKVVAKVKEVKKAIVEDAPKKTVASSSEDKRVAVGDTIGLEGFGGEIETDNGEKTTLKKLVDESAAGVVLFTYPKASTPGCRSIVAVKKTSLTAFRYEAVCAYHFRNSVFAMPRFP